MDKKRVISQIATCNGMVGKEYKKEHKKVFKSYVAQNLIDVSNNKKNVTFKSLAKEIRNSNLEDKVWFIIDESGIGKTTILEHLVFKYALRRNVRAEYIEGRNCVYKKFKNISCLKDLLENIEKAANGTTIFLDAFDEFLVLRNEDASDILDKMFEAIRNNYPALGKIVITTRLTPLKNGLQLIQDNKTNNLSSTNTKVRILKVNHFTKEQILALYTKAGGTKYININEKNKIEKLMKGKYPKRMEDYLKNHEKSIFNIPFTIKYADTLFENISDKDIGKLNVENIFPMLVEIWLKRELDIYNCGIGKSSDHLDFESFSENIFGNINDVIGYLIEKDTFQIPKDEFEKIIAQHSLIDMNSAITRNVFLQNVDGSYEFSHLLLLEYFLAKRLVKEKYKLTKKYLLDSFFSGIKKKYLNELVTSIPDIVEKLNVSIKYYNKNKIKYEGVIKEDDLIKILEADILSLKSETIFTIDEFLDIFPMVKSIYFNNMRLTGEDIESFIEEGYLDLSNQSLVTIDGIDKFGYTVCLDISGNMIQDLKPINNLTGLSELYVFNSLEGVRLDDIKIPLLEKFGTSIDLEHQIDAVLRKVNSKQYILEPNNNNLNLFVLLWKKSKEGVDIWLKSAADSSLLIKILDGEGTIDEKIYLLSALYYLKNKSFPFSRDTLLTGHNLGSCLIEQGKYEEAEELYKEVYERRKVIGEEAEATLATGHNLGHCLHKQGKYEEAEAVFKEVYERRKKAKGKEAEATLDTGHNLGYCLDGQGKYEEAEAVYKEVYERSKKARGEEAETTLITGHNLGYCLLSQGKYEEAEEVNKEVYERRKKVRGEEDEETLTTGHNLGYCLLSQGKYEEAEEVYKEVYEQMKKVIGEEAEETLTTGSNLGYCLIKQEKYEEAEEVLTEVYERRKKVIGEAAKATLSTGNNLGCCLSKQGKYEEAEAVLKEVYEKIKKVIGEEAEDTLTTGDNLVCCLNKQGKYEKAEAVLKEVRQWSDKVG